jgi:alkylhydroperoxidase family enzyme
MPLDPKRIKEREAAITGKPIRIQPVSELTDEMRALTKSPPGYEGKAAKQPAMYGVLLHNTELLRRYNDIMVYFLGYGQLPLRLRELAILRVGWLRQVPFIWGEHVAVGHRIGMTTEEIERVTVGSSAPGWSDEDRAVLKATEELLDVAMISDETWAALSKTLNEKLLVEFLSLVGQYQALGYIQNAVRVPLFEGNPGLTAR